MSIRAALCLTFVLVTPVFAQVSEPQSPATELPLPERQDPPPTAEPPRRLKFISETAPSANRIVKYDDSGTTMTGSIMVDDGLQVSVDGHLSLTSGRLFLKYPALASNGNDIGGVMGSQETISLGFNSEANFFGTQANIDGRQLYFFDRAAGRMRAVLDGNGTWWFGSSPTSYSLRVFAPAGSTRGMTIDALGNVLVGDTPIPGSRFAAVSRTDGAVAMRGYHFATIETTTSQSDFGIIVEAMNQPAAGVTNEGGIMGGQFFAWNFGPGAVSYVTGGHFVAGNEYGHGGDVSNAFGLTIAVEKGNGNIARGFGIHIADTEAVEDYGIYQVGADDANVFMGNVGIGTSAASTAKLHVAGDVIVTGNITGAKVIGAVYQDLAEWVPASTDMAPGTVVVLNLDKTNEVMPSSRRYDTTVAGVVSAAPGIILGTGDDTKEQVATTGRVKVRVDARSMPVRVGDLLVTSDVAGTAMRSEPMEINGRQFHQPGTIIGKALEPLEGGIGEILVLLSMQ